MIMIHQSSLRHYHYFEISYWILLSTKLGELPSNKSLSGFVYSDEQYAKNIQIFKDIFMIYL